YICLRHRAEAGESYLNCVVSQIDGIEPVKAVVVAGCRPGDPGVYIDQRDRGAGDYSTAGIAHDAADRSAAGLSQRRKRTQRRSKKRNSDYKKSNPLYLPTHSKSSYFACLSP